MSGIPSDAGLQASIRFLIGWGRVNRLLYLCVLYCYFFPVIGSLTISLKPPAEEILNKHLCPNPVLSSTSKLLPSQLAQILTIRLESRNRSNTYFSRFRPCTFIEDPSLTTTPLLQQQNQQESPNTTLIRIQSINLNVSPWNFSSSSNCSRLIMFRSYSEYGNGYPVMCGRENFDQFLGPYGHPMILYYHLRDQGMSFPLFHPNYEQFASASSSSSSSSSPYGSSRDQKNVLELKYMLIYYSIRLPDNTWLCRLQQYSLNPMQSSCPSPSSSSPQTCGEYPCAQLDALYQKKMSATRGDSEFQQRFIIQLHKNNTSEKYRLRNFVRQKFVPILFLVILICAYKTYMKAGLRLHDQMPMPETRLRRYHNSRLHQHHHHHHDHPMRPTGGGIGHVDPFRDIYFDGYGGAGDDAIPGALHIPFDHPSTTPRGGGGGLHPPPPSFESQIGGPCPYGKYLVHPTDPPPSYETLFPPSYNELFYSTDNSSNTSSDAKNPKV